jgi:hypothetical protein
MAELVKMVVKELFYLTVQGVKALLAEAFVGVFCKF